jgi:hypothetical protein
MSSISRMVHGSMSIKNGIHALIGKQTFSRSIFAQLNRKRGTGPTNTILS